MRVASALDGEGGLGGVEKKPAHAPAPPQMPRPPPPKVQRDGMERGQRPGHPLPRAPHPQSEGGDTPKVVLLCPEGLGLLDNLTSPASTREVRPRVPTPPSRPNILKTKHRLHFPLHDKWISHNS